MILFGVVILVILTGFSAFCASSEVAFFSIPSSKIHLWTHSTNPKHRLVSNLLRHSQRLLVTLLFFNNTTNIVLQNVASELSTNFDNSWFIKGGVPVALIIIFGEFCPKYLGMQHSEALALRIAPFFTAVGKVLLPFQKICTSIAEALSRIVFFFLKPAAPLSQKEIDQVLSICQTGGSISPDEAWLIHQAMNFEKKQVREIAIPRTHMAMIQRDQLTVSNLLALMKTSGKKNIVLIDEHAHHPIGALSSRQLLLLQHGNVQDVITEARKLLFFVPETMSTKRIFQEFTNNPILMACVIDEHGQPSGFLEWETLVNRLINEQQEFVPLSTHNITKPFSITVPGSTPLETINSSFQTNLTSKYHTSTIGGWLSEQLDDIPTADTSFVTDQLVFRIISATETSVSRVFIQRRTPPGFL